MGDPRVTVTHLWKRYAGPLTRVQCHLEPRGTAMWNIAMNNTFRREKWYVETGTLAHGDEVSVGRDTEVKTQERGRSKRKS